MMNLKGTGNDFSRFYCGGYKEKPYTELNNFSMIVNFEDMIYALNHFGFDVSKLKKEEFAMVFSLSFNLDENIYEIHPAGIGFREICFVSDFKKIIEGK